MGSAAGCKNPYARIQMRWGGGGAAAGAAAHRACKLAPPLAPPAGGQGGGVHGDRRPAGGRGGAAHRRWASQPCAPGASRALPPAPPHARRCLAQRAVAATLPFLESAEALRDPECFALLDDTVLRDIERSGSQVSASQRAQHSTRGVQPRNALPAPAAPCWLLPGRRLKPAHACPLAFPALESVRSLRACGGRGTCCGACGPGTFTSTSAQWTSPT